MFYSQFILAKKGPLGTIWIAAHLERKLRKNQVADTDIGVSVDSIIFPEVPIALRLSSHLMLGVVRIYSRKVNYLFHDCSEALLKIKQAFRSTAVDLPPEESTAPYHSITLPETFHLDDFELPETAFQGDADHHISTKEQITLQDNPERTGYSTSQFGLDERFGDGNSSHLGLDLEEELMLNKDHSIQLESDDGIIIQGRSSVHPSDMDIDDKAAKNKNMEGYGNMDDGPSSHNKLNLLNSDELVGNTVPNWSGYNMRTPDLNDILLHNEDDAGPSASYYQPSPFPCDEPASPEFISAQAPATPGLMEETVPSRVHESPVLSPQRKTSPSSNDEIAKTDNSVAPPSDFLHPDTENANDVAGAEMTELGLDKPVQVESSGAVQKIATVDSPPQEIATEDLPPQAETSNLEATVDNSLINIPEPCTDGSAEPSIIENRTQFNEGSDDVQQYNLHASNVMVASAEFQQNIEAIPQELVTNDRPSDLSASEFPERERMLSTPYVEFYQANDLGQLTAEKGTTELVANDRPSDLSASKFPERERMLSRPYVEFYQANDLVQVTAEKGTTELVANDRPSDLSASKFPERERMLSAPYVEFYQANDLGQVTAEKGTTELVANDRPGDLSASRFPERERMLSTPYVEFYQANDLGQVTAEKGTTESDGSNKIGSLTSRKRHLEDSLPALESGATENLYSGLRGKRTNDVIPNDDDLLASILVGRTPGLQLGSTPLPPKPSSLKRPRLASKTATPKRKVQTDDAMVIHADTIRQQLISTEDIRRIRKKAPCTRSEIWMIEKGSLEDDIFHEPVFSCICKELNGLHYRTYETVSHVTVQNMELHERLGMPETIEVDINNVASAAMDSATLDHQHHMVLPDGAQTDAMQARATDVADATAAFGLQVPYDKHINNEFVDFVANTMFEGVTEPFIGNEREIELGEKTNDQVDRLDKDHLEDVSADLQRSTNCDAPLFVLDDITPGSTTGISDARDVLDGSGPTCAQTVDDMKGELNGNINGDVHAFENKELPTSEITGIEFTQITPGFPQTTEEENGISAMGENSGLQENNIGSAMDLDNLGHDFALKECSDFGSAIHGVDTDFLNYDDDGDFDEGNDDELNPEEFQSLDNSGWSSRTRGVARYLKKLFDEESGLGRKNVAIDHLLSGKTRKEASRMFFETLVLTTKDYIHVEQPKPFDFVSIKPGPKLLKSNF